VARLTTCPRGSAEGLIVLSIEDPVDVEKLARELTGRPGLWSVMFGEVDWSAASAQLLLDAIGDVPLVSTIDLIAPPATWPVAEANWIADATALLRECPTDHDLAMRLGAIEWIPAIRDLCLDLDAEQLPPSAAALSMLETALRPSCCCIYLARDYPYRATLLRNVATSSTHWAVRWLP